MPANPEELRERIDLLAAGVEFFKLKQPAVKAFEKMDEMEWSRHVKYILGPKVRGKHVLDAQGNVVKIPEWGTILSYEQAIRALAARYMNEGCSDNNYAPMMMHEAMKKARENSELRTDEFVEKLNLQERTDNRRRGNNAASSGDVPEQKIKGGGKGGKEGKDKKVRKEKIKKTKGGGKGGKDKLPAGKPLLTTHGKEPICFAYNNKGEGCKKQDCRRAHVCQICLGSHPLHACKA